MDSPHLLHLGFLLLALAAPCLSIAVSTAGPAEETQGSPNVTVYCCKDCKTCPQKPMGNSFENCTKITETQNKTFSDVKIDLVTNGTHITVCFEQANSCLEGIYGIFWMKALGIGMSCGILNSGENGRGNVSTEEKNICCEAETIAWKHSPALKCYTQKPHQKPTTLPVGIPGNPEFLTSKKNSLGVLFSFLFVGVCSGWATMYYFSRLRRGQAFRQDRKASDRENLTHP